MSGRPRPMARVLVERAALLMIEQHAGRPCPSRREVMEWTGVPRRQVWRFLGALAERGLIEIEAKNSATKRRRRLRLAGGDWTGWTSRPGRRAAARIAATRIAATRIAAAGSVPGERERACPAS